eukprot:s5322_g4.t1
MDFTRRARLAFERTPRHKRHLLGSGVASSSNLTHQERLSAQAATSNSLRMDDVEKVLRFMEDELVHTDQSGAGPRRDPRRRTYAVERSA